MKTPPSRLLKAANSTSPVSPGTSRTARNAPPKSTILGTSSLCTTSSSGITTVSRCSSETTVSATAMTIVQVMPS